MVRATRERRVVERAQRLLDELRLAAHLDDERLGDRSQRVRRGDAEGAAVEPGQVLGAAGERHDRMQRERQSAGTRRRRRARRRRTARWCARASWPDRMAPAPTSPSTRPGQCVVGDGQQHELGGGHDRPAGRAPECRAAARRRGDARRRTRRTPRRCGGPPGAAPRPAHCRPGQRRRRPPRGGRGGRSRTRVRGETQSFRSSPRAGGYRTVVRSLRRTVAHRDHLARGDPTRAVRRRWFLS